jgi:hypothetical protein
MNLKINFFSENLVIFFPLLICAVLAGCDPEDPVPVEEQELITTVNISFTKVGTTDGPIIFSWRDLDGSGPDAPAIEPIVIDAHSTYTVTLELLNESGSPAEDVTSEIEEESEDHQFFFSFNNVDEVVLTYDDVDGKGKPVGIKSIISTEHFGTGTLGIILLHLPDKNGIGVSEGNPANAGGETDLDIQFPLTIEE